MGEILATREPREPKEKKIKKTAGILARSLLKPENIKDLQQDKGKAAAAALTAISMGINAFTDKPAEKED